MKTLCTTAVVLAGAWWFTPGLDGQTVKTATVSGSYLGVMLQEIDGNRAKELKLPEPTGVEVTRVEAGSPADTAGLRSGDVIVQYNGQRVDGMEQFSRLVRETPAGRDAKLSIVRGGAPQSLTARVGVRHAPVLFAPLGDRFNFQMPDLPRSLMSWRSSVLGLEAESLEGQLADYFGVKEGVLVRSVANGSAAERAGIHAGDVITRVDDAAVATPAEISSRIRRPASNSVPVTLMRDHKEVTVTVALERDDRFERLSPRSPASGRPGLPVQVINLPVN